MEEKKKPIFKKWWFWVIIIIVVIAISGSSGNNTSITSGNINSETDNEQESSTQTANVGDIVQTKEVKISYISCKQFTNYNSYAKPAAENKVMRLEFEFENISNSDIVLGGFDCYADGAKCDAYYYADDYKNSTLESLSKGKKVKAILYYEVPKTAQETVLEYETDYWSNEKVEFIVK